MKIRKRVTKFISFSGASESPFREIDVLLHHILEEKCGCVSGLVGVDKVATWSLQFSRHHSHFIILIAAGVRHPPPSTGHPPSSLALFLQILC